MQIIKIYEGKDACQQCLGWKRIDDVGQKSWKYWEELPAINRIAITMGLVKPIECPRCKESGKEPEVKK